MSSTDNPNQFIYQQTQQYTTRLLKKKKVCPQSNHSPIVLRVTLVQVIESIIIVEMDDNDKIIRLIDRWDGKDLPYRYGASFLRTLNGKVTPWLVRVPKAKKTT